MSDKRKRLVRELMATHGYSYQAALQELAKRAELLQHMPPAEAERALDSGGPCPHCRGPNDHGRDCVDALQATQARYGL